MSGPVGSKYRVGSRSFKWQVVGVIVATAPILIPGSDSDSRGLETEPQPLPLPHLYSNPGCGAFFPISTEGALVSDLCQVRINMVCRKNSSFPELLNFASVLVF